MKNQPPNDIYRQAGMAAFLPGMQYMLDLMQQQLEEMRAQLNGAQNGQPRKPERGTDAYRAYDREKHRLARERARAGRNSKRAMASKASWASMTAEERSIEMKRRIAVRKAKQEGRFHIADPRNPNHERWLENTKKSRQREWQNMSPAMRKARLAKMDAGRHKAAAERRIA